MDKRTYKLPIVMLITQFLAIALIMLIFALLSSSIINYISPKKSLFDNALELESINDESKRLEIFTNGDILYVNLDSLVISKEAVDTVLTFDNFDEMADYISVYTASKIKKY